MFNNTHQLIVDNKTIEFKFNTLEGLEDFEKKISPELLSNILSQLPTVKKDMRIPEIPEYKSEEGLKICIKEIQQYFLIFSIGEYQYGLYKMFVEAVLKK